MKGKYSNAANRWEGIGPYYAMFPNGFAKRVIKKYTGEGDVILDPFAGRGTSIFAAATNKRRGIGIEINPVGWVYAKAKLSSVSMEKVMNRLNDVSKASHRYDWQAKSLPDFFRHCYSHPVLRFLQAARIELNWQSNSVDTTLMALILVNLHGKYGNALSNQMRQTKSMSPQYAIKWWASRKLSPPVLDPKDFLSKRIEWRYKYGIPLIDKKSVVYLGDCSKLLPKIKKDVKSKGQRPRLLFTSPPYLGITNYYYDQWLRLWMLGSSPHPGTLKDPYKRKFSNAEEYKRLLEQVFTESAQLLTRDATVYVRTDQRKETYEITKSALVRAFPGKTLTKTTRLFHRLTQTHLFNKKSRTARKISGGEIDLIMTPS